MPLDVLPETVTEIDNPREAIQPRAPTLDLTHAKRLSDYTSEWVFFNHLALVNLGGLDTDLIAEWLTLQASNGSEVIRFDLGWPLFKTLCAGPLATCADADRILLAVNVEAWPSLRDYIRAVSLRSRPRQFFGRATTQELEIVDPLALKRPGSQPLPRMRIACFGLDCNQGQVIFASGPDHSLPVRVHWQPPTLETQRLAHAMLAHHDKPFTAIELPVDYPTTFQNPLQD